MQASDSLIAKLDAFIKKYYKNKLLRGVIYFMALTLGSFILVASVEYYGRFGTGTRTLLFYAFVVLFLYIFIQFIIIPLSKLKRIGKVISHRQAAAIISTHFTEVQDKLINVLELKSAIGSNNHSAALLEAAIAQKTAALSPIPFNTAVRYEDNKQHIKWLVLPLVLLVIISIKAPELLTDGTNRLLQHQTPFEQPAPFTFSLSNKNLNAIVGEDLEIGVNIKGSILPAEVFIELEGKPYRMEKLDQNNFTYLYKNVRSDFDFRFTAGGFNSGFFKLDANDNPKIDEFDMQIVYPSYTQIKSETVENTGDLHIPKGTKVQWVLKTRHADKALFLFEDTTIALQHAQNGVFSFSRKLLKSGSYALTTNNAAINSRDTLSFQIEIIEDKHPNIAVQEQQDSLSSKRIYFNGSIKDDYGFTKMNFVYEVKRAGTSAIEKHAANVAINLKATNDQFYYTWDGDVLQIAAGDEVNYYFEIFDNDAINGPKSMRSGIKTFRAPSLEEVIQQTDQRNENTKDNMEKTIQEIKKLQKDLNDLSKKMLEKKEVSWEDKKKAKDLIAKKQALDQKIQNIKEQIEKTNRSEEEYKTLDPELAEKQHQLEALMNKVMTPELQKMMEEMQRLMETADKKKMDEQMQKMNTDNKELLKDLDRTLELFKQLEFEKKLQDNIDQLKSIAEKQETLSEKASEKNSDSDQLKKEQDELNKKFDDLQKELSEMKQKNEALEEKNDLPNTEQQEQSIAEEMQNASEQLQQKQKAKAGKSQQSAADKMKEMAQKMEQAQQENEQQQAEENIDDLRALLENLLQLSFGQEQVMQQLKTLDINNPLYLKAAQRQQKIKDDMRLVEDSLQALAKRVVQVAAAVNKEVSTINQNMVAAIDNLEDRFVPQARSNQQFAMTSINNLTLLLNEALNQMMQQSASKKSGSGKCNKPGGGGKPSISKLKKMQEELNKNMAKMQEQMKKNGNKPGQKGKPGEGTGMSEQLAKMAAQQEYIRNMLGKINQDENKDGTNSLGNLGELMKKMEETESEVVNRMITEQTLKRQQDILTRLLESEKAERERDQDEQRKSEEAKKQFERNPAALEEYKRMKEKELELLRTVPPALNSYYRQKVSEYFQSID